MAVLAIQTMLFQDYSAAWAAEEVWSSLVVLSALWSCWVSYTGATTAFPASRGRAAVWFLGLPLAIYTVVLGVIGLVYAWLDMSRSGGA